MISREAIAAESRTWLGTPFAHQHCTKQIGVDCIGVVVGVALTVGIAEATAWQSDQDFKGYTRTPNVPRLFKAVDRYLDKILPVTARLGDILLLSFFGEPMHFAIISQVTPRPLMIHGYSIVGRVVENGIDQKWQRRVVAAYRYRGVE